MDTCTWQTLFCSINIFLLTQPHFLLTLSVWLLLRTAAPNSHPKSEINYHTLHSIYCFCRAGTVVCYTASLWWFFNVVLLSPESFSAAFNRKWKVYILFHKPFWYPEKCKLGPQLNSGEKATSQCCTSRRFYLRYTGNAWLWGRVGQVLIRSQHTSDRKTCL